ncbi:MAG: arsenite methyltransferase [Rhodothermales bacterium]
MNDQATIKEEVRRKYGEIAVQGHRAGCCGPSNVTCCGADVTMIGDEYEGVEGYVAEADLGLGCGMPTELADISEGDTVLDLGSGAGLDVFVARKLVGESGRVIGVDMTDSMVAKARENARTLNYENVDFYLGDIESLPLESSSVDVVISNCVLNLVPDKAAAFSEMFRVIRPGGHFCVSDIVIRGELPESVRRSAELYAGCVGGAIKEEEYLSQIVAAGFQDVDVAKEKTIDVPDETLLEVATEEEVRAFRQSGGAIVSVTVKGRKTA